MSNTPIILLLFLSSFLPLLFSCNNKAVEVSIPENLTEINIDEIKASLSPKEKMTLFHQPETMQLAEKNWTLNHYTLGSTNDQNKIIEGTSHTLKFDIKEALLTGTLDCNTYKAEPQLGNHKLKISTFAITKEKCFFKDKNNAKILRQQQDILNILSQNLELEIIDDTMIVFSDNGDFLSYLAE